MKLNETNSASAVSAHVELYLNWNRGKQLHLRLCAMRKGLGDAATKSTSEEFSLKEKGLTVKGTYKDKSEFAIPADQAGNFPEGSSKLLAGYYQLNKALLSLGTTSDEFFAAEKLQGDADAAAGRAAAAAAANES